jgi:hypothetical protein
MRKIARTALVALLPLAACADVWGFHDLTQGEDGGGLTDGEMGDGSLDASHLAISEGDCAATCDGMTIVDARDAPEDAATDVGLKDGGGLCLSPRMECNGICVDTTSDASNCGACGNVCSTSVGNSRAVCVQGACSFACDSGYSRCTGDCVQYSSATNCGGCGVACNADSGTPLCAASGGSYSCVSGCPAATPTPCSGSCVDTTASSSNCGVCGNGCSTSIANATPVCLSSTCGFTCNNGYGLCNGGCVDFSTDPSNCGGCGPAYACSGGTICQSSICVPGPGPDSGTSDAGSDAGPAGPTCGPKGTSFQCNSNQVCCANLSTQTNACAATCAANASLSCTTASDCPQSTPICCAQATSTPDSKNDPSPKCTTTALSASCASTCNDSPPAAGCTFTGTIRLCSHDTDCQSDTANPLALGLANQCWNYNGAPESWCTNAAAGNGGGGVHQP